VTETLEVVPRQWRVVQYVREKFTCRACERISQAPAPFHVLPRGFAGPSLFAMIRTPSIANARMASLVSSRRRNPSYWMRSAQVSKSEFIVVAPMALRIWRIDLRTASREARLAFSIRCQRSATCIAWGTHSARKEKWIEKIRSDVAGIVETDRGYQRIICVTARFARAKARAALEDELTAKYGIPVTINDRSWIVKEVIDGDRKDLACNYLGVGHLVEDGRRLGPKDYSRSQQLGEIEKVLGDPAAFAGMEMQRATEALVAAKLSRQLERPRHETEGRLARAIRFAYESPASVKAKLKQPPKRKPTRKRGQQPHVPTYQSLATVKAMSCVGYSQAVIARYIPPAAETRVILFGSLRHNDLKKFKRSCWELSGSALKLAITAFASLGPYCSLPALA
jgi:hypothetical protein